MRRTALLAPWMLAAACTGAPADSDSAADSASTTDDTSGDTTGIPWIRHVGTDTSTYAAFDVVVDSYAVTADNPKGYRDPQGGDPLFYVLHPATFATEGPHPALLWLHGSAIGIEGDDDAGKNCSHDGIFDAVVSDIVGGDYDSANRAFVASEIARLDWLWVVPENTWCDLWTGLGDDDPVRPEHHGAQHVRTVLAALETGVDGMQADPQRLFAWGTSIGGVGAVVASHDFDTISMKAVVVDSSPINPVTWYWDPDGSTNEPYSSYLDHIFGGPAVDRDGTPTDYYVNYERADATLLVSDGGFRVPMFQAYNTFDHLVPVIQHENLAADLDQAYPPDGVRYFHHDFSHHAPGSLFHIQTGWYSPPFSYTTRAIFDFLRGADIDWFEAEDTCTGGCTIDAEPEGTTELYRTSAYSQGAVVLREERDGPGTLYTGLVPATVPRGAAITLLPVVVAQSVDVATDADVLVTFTLSDATGVLATKSVTRADLVNGHLAETSADERQSAFAEYVHQVDATEWDIPSIPAGDVTITASYGGIGSVYLDGFWVVSGALAP